MSQYRNDRDAARQRVAELEMQLAEREAALSSQDVAVAERDAEIARLRHQLVLAGILGHRVRPAQTVLATRMVGLAVAIAATSLGVGLLALRAPRPVIVEVVQAATAAPMDPIFADPALGLLPPTLIEEPPATPPSVDEASVRREIEPRVWSGRASVEEIRLLKAICSHQGDRACRNRAAALLPRPKSPVF